MKRPQRLCGFVLLAGFYSHAAATPDEGGRDVSVTLSSTHIVKRVTVTPMGPSAWEASCADCRHKPFGRALQFKGPGELFAGGLLRVKDSESGQTQTAAGLWHLRSNPSGDQLDVVLTIPSERYVAAVLNAEESQGEPLESLRSLAIVARTYALNGIHYTAQAGHLASDLCDSTQCQAVRLGPVRAAIQDAVQSTAGETLWFGSHRAEVFFSQSCGGLTEDGGAVWPKLHGLDYLQSHLDPYCLRRDTAAWHTEVSLADFEVIASFEHWRVPGKITAVLVGKRSPSHRALEVTFMGNDGKSSSVAANALRFGIGRALGWNRIRSDAYEVGLRNGELVFDGRGHGHGVGLCQTGAAEMAAEGKDSSAILSFYFPGTAVHIMSNSARPSDERWHETRIDSLSIRTDGVLSPSEESTFRMTWQDAQKRFPPRRPVTAKIIVAPTTELFRQLTSQPGWELASTRGTTIVLQPESLLRAQGRRLPDTLLHEMLHVLIEAEASDRAPLWLREGLVEALAVEGPISSPRMSTSEIDSTLSRPNSWAASERAHRAAAAKVQGAIARYGFPTVRGWLSSGPPSTLE
ncbi:MAG TPA: SpoIID/LytB domain-containing protein [Acidisarcina sp.]